RRLRVLCTNIYLLPAREHRPDLHAFPTRRSSDLAVMNAGSLEQADSPWALYNRPRTRFVAEFIGRTNLVEGVMQDDHIRCDGFSIGASVFDANGKGVGSPVSVSIRPQALRLNAERPAHDPDATPVVIKRRTYLGEHWDY